GVGPPGTALLAPPPMYRQEEPRSEIFVAQAVSESISPENGAVGGVERPVPPQDDVPGAVVYLSDRAPRVVVVVLDVVVVVGAAVVVVVLPGAPHVPPGPHASQQLGTDPTHAVPPRGGLQADSLLLIEQLVLPLLSVRQQVTKPGLPQVDCASQLITAPEHGGRSDPFSTASSVTISTQST